MLNFKIKYQHHSQINISDDKTEYHSFLILPSESLKTFTKYVHISASAIGQNVLENIGISGIGKNQIFLPPQIQYPHL